MYIDTHFDFFAVLAVYSKPTVGITIHTPDDLHCPYFDTEILRGHLSNNTRRHSGFATLHFADGHVYQFYGIFRWLSSNRHSLLERLTWSINFYIGKSGLVFNPSLQFIVNKDS